MVDWFRRRQQFIKLTTTDRRLDLPDGLWVKCEDCGELIYRKDLEGRLMVCPKCNYHCVIGAKDRLQMILDEGAFTEEYDANLSSVNPLSFPEYEAKIKKGQKNTGLLEAVITGEGKIEGRTILLGIVDFGFLGGSMGSVVGEKIARLFERALTRGLPVVVISGGGGGARMHEGMISLMQMAKTSAVVAKLKAAKVPYISVFTNPTMGGVAASFAALGDVNIAEPKARIGFAGPRVIEQTIGHRLPEGFQTAEFLLEHGMIDMIVSRLELKATLAKVIDFLS